MPYPFNILKNEKLKVSANDVETFVRHALGQHLFIVEREDLDKTHRRYRLDFWQREIALDNYMDDGKIGKTYWGGMEVVEWSDATEIIRMWAANPEDWYLGEFSLDKDKVMEERFERLEELSDEIKEKFAGPMADKNLLKQEILMLDDSVKDGKNRKVFVIHGRNENLRRSMFDFLRAISLNPIEWSDAIAITGKGSPYIGEVLDRSMDEAQAIIVLLTGDDEAKLKDEHINDHDPDYERHLYSQARPNVLFEAGMAFGKYQDRTILVQIGNIRPFSDIAGRHVIHLSNSIKSRQDLASRLETAGCLVNQKGTDWHSAGKFSVAKQKTVVPKAKVKTVKPQIDQRTVLIEKVASEKDLPVNAIYILITMTYIPKSIKGEISVDALAQVMQANPLRIRKDCELLESRGWVKRGNSRFEDINYYLTENSKDLLLQTGLV